MLAIRNKYHLPLPLLLIAKLELMKYYLVNFSWMSQVEMLPKPLYHDIIVLFYVGNILKQGRRSYHTNRNMCLIHEIVYTWLDNYKKISIFENIHDPERSCLLSSILKTYESFIDIDAVVARTVRVYEIETNVLLYITARIDNFVILNNLLIFSAFNNDHVVFNECLKHGADDLVTSKKMAALKQNFAMIEYISTFSERLEPLEKYRSCKIYKFYHDTMDNLDQVGYTADYMRFFAFKNSWVYPACLALKKDEVHFDAPMGVWRYRNMFRNMCFLEFDTIFRVVRCMITAPDMFYQRNFLTFTPTPENSDNDNDDDSDDSYDTFESD